MASNMGEGEPWLLLAMFGHTPITLINIIVNLLIYSIKMIYEKLHLLLGVCQIAHFVGAQADARSGGAMICDAARVARHV